jgi:hypothetical protein
LPHFKTALTENSKQRPAVDSYQLSYRLQAKQLGLKNTERRLLGYCLTAGANLRRRVFGQDDSWSCCNVFAGLKTHFYIRWYPQWTRETASAG